MATRLDNAFAGIRRDARVGVVPYVTVGFPDLDDTLRVVPAIEAAGADVIELGVPYSDPLADGPTHQASSYRALRNGVSVSFCLDTARALREGGVQAPLLFMGYYNPILAYGIDAYARACADAGVDGLIVPDLPPEEADALRGALHANGLQLVSMLAPTSTRERIRAACAAAEGFVYCVSVAGVTGARSDLPPGLPDFVARVRAETDVPIGVGFGIAEPRHVAGLRGVADAAVVGSALTNAVGAAPPGERAAVAAAFVGALAQEGRRA